MSKWLTKLIARFRCKSKCCMGSDCAIEPSTADSESDLAVEKRKQNHLVHDV